MIMTKRSVARASQLIDNDQVRVTRFEFRPDDETGWHEHGFDYVIVALTDCTMLIEEGKGAVSYTHLTLPTKLAV